MVPADDSNDDSNDAPVGAWKTWARDIVHTVTRLEDASVRLNEDVRKLEAGLAKLDKVIALVNVKAGLVGLVGGAVPVAVLVLIRYLTK